MNNDFVMDDLLAMRDEYVLANKHGLNIGLAISKGITLEDFKSLQDLYEVADSYIEQLESEIDIQNTLEKLTEVEFLIQEAWTFGRNSDYHYFSFKPDNCKCPKIDNMDMIGSKYRVYNSICPIHKIRRITN